MSVGFRAVQWNRAKLVYDAILLAGVALFIGGLPDRGRIWLDPPKDLPAAIDLRIRAFGTCAFLMLTIILSIGPLARLDRRFLPLLYNRRHFGVLTFLVALAARLVHARVVRGAGRAAEPLRRAHQLDGLRQVHRLPVQDARASPRC